MKAKVLMLSLVMILSGHLLAAEKYLRTDYCIVTNQLMGVDSSFNLQAADRTQSGKWPAANFNYTNVTIEAIMPRGYRVIGWSYGSFASLNTAQKDARWANFVSTGDTNYTWSWDKCSSANEMALSPHFDWIYYNISYDGNGATSGSLTAKRNVHWDVTWTLPQAPYIRLGYAFAGWSTNKTGSALFENQAAVDGDRLDVVHTQTNRTLYAVWKPETYTLWLNAGDGASIASSEMEVTYGEAYGTLPTPQKIGYSLQRWTTAQTGGTVITSSTKVMTPSNHWAYAQMTQNVYQVTLDPQGGLIGTSVKNPLPVTYDGKYQSLPTATRYGYTLRDGVKWWSQKENGEPIENNVTDVKVAADHTIYAQWAPKTWTLSFHPMGGSVLTAQMDLTFGAEYGNLPTPTKIGADFGGWFVSTATDAQEITSSMLATNLAVTTVYARWTDTPYTVSLENGDGTAQTVTAYYGKSLPAITPPTKVGYHFNGYYDASQKQYYNGDGSAASNWDKTSPDTLQAAWVANTYTVRFFPNGGEGEIYDQLLTYDAPSELVSNNFLRTSRAFEGWMLKPGTDIAFADGATVSNLTSEAGAVVGLLAKWMRNDSVDSPLSEAADCATTVIGDHMALRLVPQPENEVSVETGTDVGGNGQFVRLLPAEGGTKTTSVTITVPKGSGTLSFWYQVKIKYPEEAEASSFEVYDGRVSNVPILETKTSVGAWTEYRLTDCEFAEETEIKFIMSVAYLEDGDYALIDKICWNPDTYGDGVVGVTFLSKDTEGTYSIVTNMTKTANEAVGELPDIQFTAGEFCGWSTTEIDGAVIDENWLVPQDDTVLYAQYLKDAVAPTVVTGLVYTGEALTGVDGDGIGYMLEGAVATNAGSYVATATLKPGYRWESNQTAAKTYPWSIAKATYDMSGVTFTNATYEVDGTTKTLAITGVLPVGVTVTYMPSNRCETAGMVQVTAVFTGDETNYETIPNLAATLTLVEPEPEPEPEPKKMPVSLPKAVTSLAYTGSAQAGISATNVVTVIGGIATNAGAYVATVILNEGYCWPDGTTDARTVNWSIAKAVYDLSGIAFEDATYEMDGAAKTIAITGTLPTGVTVAYSPSNTRTEAGSTEVTANFVGDGVNYAAIPSLKATLTVTLRTSFPQGVVGERYANFGIASIWPDAAENPKDWKISGWPSGLKYATKDDKKGTYRAYEVYGTPKKAGIFTIKAVHKVRNPLTGKLTGEKETYAATLTVVEIIPDCSLDFGSTPVNPITGAVELLAGVNYSWPIKYDGTTTLSASGLPSGLKLAKAKDKTYCVQGVPSKAGSYKATIKTKLSSTVTLLTLNMTVKALPTWVVGSFDGGSELGQATFKVTAKGSLTGKFIEDGHAWKMTSSSFKTCDEAAGICMADVTFKEGKTTVIEPLTFTVDDVAGLVTSEVMVARQNLWKTDWKAVEKICAKAPKLTITGDQIGTDPADIVELTFASKGAVKAKIVSGGKKASYSAVLCPLTSPKVDDFDAELFLRGVVVPVHWNGREFQLLPAN